MLTQTQYDRLCANVEKNDLPLHADVADLLESYELLSAALDRLCMTGSQVIQAGDFELLYDLDGEPLVRLKRDGR